MKDYTELSKMEMHKYLTDLAVQLIKDGYWEKREDGISCRLDISIENIAKLHRKLMLTMIYHIFE